MGRLLCSLYKGLVADAGSARQETPVGSDLEAEGQAEAKVWVTS
jgi:hypothetical protein